MIISKLEHDRLNLEPLQNYAQSFSLQNKLNLKKMSLSFGGRLKGWSD